MSGLWRRILTAAARVLGVGAIAALLVLLLLVLTRGGPVGPARIIFAGTQDDADCAVLLSRDACVLIDTGEEQDAAHILELLGSWGVERIDCLILTHPDKDHIGGAEAILHALPVGQIIVPYYEKENKRYAALREAVAAKGLPLLTTARNREFVYGDLRLRVYPPEDFYYEKDNDYSLAVAVRHGAVRLFFAGDAQKQRLQELLRLPLEAPVDLYKVAYHGRDSQAGSELILQLQPQYAVVTAESPKGRIKDVLDASGTQVVCTLGSDAVFVSDGEALSPEQ